jgi:hypothetical protein
MTRRLVVAGLGLVLSMQTSFAQEQGDKDQEAMREYNEVGKIGMEAFQEGFKVNSVVMRTSAMLQACGQDGLARAVLARQQDPKFLNVLRGFLKVGRFDNLPESALFSAQNVANGVRLGHEIGYEQAVSHIIGSDNAIKAVVCDAAIQSANDILK